MSLSYQHREKYGRILLTDASFEAIIELFIESGKRQVVFWAEYLKPLPPSMTYDTFQTHVREYLRRKNKVLSAIQLERIRLSETEVQRFTALYLKVATTVFNKAHFFEEYIIVPPYEAVPSYDQFRKKLDLNLKARQQTHQAIDVLKLLSISAHSTDLAEEVKTSTVCSESAFNPPVAEEYFEDDLGYISQAARYETENDFNHCNILLESDVAVDKYLTKTTSKHGYGVKATTSLARVTTSYRCIQQSTGSLGGNGSGGPIYGELTVGSMQHVIDYLVQSCEYSAASRFIDVGSGRGKPNFHVAQDPGVCLSIGIEVEEIRWKVTYIYLY